MSRVTNPVLTEPSFNMSNPSHIPAVPGRKHVPLRTKVMWGFGGLADNFMFNTLAALGTLVYVNHFKLSPALAGLALGLPRIFDAITDPLIGNLSDNSKSRFGRRRPFMFVGVLGCVLLLPLLWTLPMTETAANPWYSNVPFLYIVVVGSLLALAYTFFVVPYTALGFELTPDYDERTRVVRWRMYIGLFGSLAAGWLFRLAADEYWPSLGAGAFWVSVGVAAIVLVAGMIPVFGCKEELFIEKQEPIRFLEAVRYTMTNRPFVILFVAYLTIIVALFSAQSIAPLIMHHYVFGGDAIKLGNFQGALMTMAVALSYISIFLISWISMRTSKRTAMVSGLVLAFAGTALSFVAMDPRWPWMLFLSSFLAFLGLQGCWLMVDSMTADVCDDDELRTGRRREGMFSAVKSFALKAAQGLTFGIGGYMATAAGYDPQIVERAGLDENTAWKMKAALVGFQCAGLLLAIAIMWLYPITRQRAEETQRKLREIAH
jgi:GPH family glycoside/pentoside/hexuronide:cation symporter